MNSEEASEEEQYKNCYENSKKARSLATCKIRLFLIYIKNWKIYLILSWHTGYLLSCSYASTMGGLGSLVGTSTNVFFKGYYDQNYPEYNLGFLNFFAYALPVSILVILVTWAFLIVRFLPREYFHSHFNKKKFKYQTFID